MAKNIIVSVSISLPYDTLCEVDDVAAEDKMSRSAYVLNLIYEDLEKRKTAKKIGVAQ